MKQFNYLSFFFRRQQASQTQESVEGRGKAEEQATRQGLPRK